MLQYIHPCRCTIWRLCSR